MLGGYRDEARVHKLLNPSVVMHLSYLPIVRQFYFTFPRTTKHECSATGMQHMHIRRETTEAPPQSPVARRKENTEQTDDLGPTVHHTCGKYIHMYVCRARRINPARAPLLTVPAKQKRQLSPTATPSAQLPYFPPPPTHPPESKAQQHKPRASAHKIKRLGSLNRTI